MDTMHEGVISEIFSNPPDPYVLVCINESGQEPIEIEVSFTHLKRDGVPISEGTLLTISTKWARNGQWQGARFAVRPRRPLSSEEQKELGDRSCELDEIMKRAKLPTPSGFRKRKL